MKLDAQTKADLRLHYPALVHFAELQKPKPVALDERRKQEQRKPLRAA